MISLEQFHQRYRLAVVGYTSIQVVMHVFRQLQCESHRYNKGMTALLPYEEPISTGDLMALPITVLMQKHQWM